MHSICLLHNVGKCYVWIFFFLHILSHQCFCTMNLSFTLIEAEVTSYFLERNFFFLISSAISQSKAIKGNFLTSFKACKNLLLLRFLRVHSGIIWLKWWRGGPWSSCKVDWDRCRQRRASLSLHQQDGAACGRARLRDTQGQCLASQGGLTLWDPTGWSPPGSSVLGTAQTRTLQWLPFPPPGGLPDSGVKLTSPVSSALAGGFFTHWSIREARKTSQFHTILGCAGERDRKMGWCWLQLYQ